LLVPGIRDVEEETWVIIIDIYFTTCWTLFWDPMFSAALIWAAPIFLWPFSTLFTVWLGLIKEEADIREDDVYLHRTWYNGLRRKQDCESPTTPHRGAVPRAYVMCDVSWAWFIGFPDLEPLEIYDVHKELTRRVIKIQIIRIRKIQEISCRGWDTWGSSIGVEKLSIDLCLKQGEQGQ
jgi:hypothetical protein